MESQNVFVAFSKEKIIFRRKITFANKFIVHHVAASQPHSLVAVVHRHLESQPVAAQHESVLLKIALNN